MGCIARSETGEPLSFLLYFGIQMSRLSEVFTGNVRYMAIVHEGRDKRLVRGWIQASMIERSVIE